MVTGQTGTVRQAVDDYKQGKVKGSIDATVSDHYGMGKASMGQSGGRGMGGRGMGQGMGRGMGGSGMGRGMGGRGKGQGGRGRGQ